MQTFIFSPYSGLWREAHLSELAVLGGGERRVASYSGKQNLTVLRQAHLTLCIVLKVTKTSHLILWAIELLQDELRHIKHCHSYFSKKSIGIGQHQTGSGWECSLTGTGERQHRERVQKQRKEIIWLALAWSQVCWLRLVALGVWIL